MENNLREILLLTEKIDVLTVLLRDTQAGLHNYSWAAEGDAPGAQGHAEDLDKVTQGWAWSEFPSATGPSSFLSGGVEGWLRPRLYTSSLTGLPLPTACPWTHRHHGSVPKRLCGNTTDFPPKCTTNSGLFSSKQTNHRPFGDGAL